MIIHLMGAQKANFPWGFENRLIKAIRELGHDLISTDFRQERSRLPHLFRQKADLVLICKGEGIEPHLIESCPCITALWYAEQVGTPERCDETALARRQELSFNIHAFDYVFSHDPANLLVYRQLGAEEIYSLPCAAVDPEVNRKLDIPKRHEVVFIGTKTPRRRTILESLRKQGIDVFSPDIWDAEEMNRLFNESRIVINIHLSDLLNTETRVAEVLGSGSFLMSETLSDRDLVAEGTHFIGFDAGDINQLAAKIRRYLSGEEERESIAASGHRHIHQHHTYAARIKCLLGNIDISRNRRIWPAYIYGVPTNTRMKPTLRIDRYNDAVRKRLRSFLPLPEPATLAQRHVMGEGQSATKKKFINLEAYKNDGWGLSKLAFKKIYEIIADNFCPLFRIIEFGSGISTQFLVDCALEFTDREFQILSFDNDPEYMYKSSQSYEFFNILLRNLLECDDRQYEFMFQNKKYSRELMHDKMSPLTTRQKNNFYDIRNEDINGCYDLMILDGPNGNGRNIGFLHMIDHLKAGSCVLIDDFTHYDFVARFKSIYPAEEIFRHEGGMSDQWNNGGDFIIFRLT